MYAEDLDTSSIIYTHTFPCPSFIIALNAVIHSCAPCSSRAHRTPSSLRSRGREKHDAEEEAGPIRWALARIDLSPAHLPLAVGAQRAKVALKFFLWQLQGEARRPGRGKRWKGKENAFHAI